ncbi:RING finger protein 145-like [Antedon mediterranea]|uniref:RING finger protein 145-like n=1 Tax=Antedon mediterranea TaxID=105859 RepID=UPI003AF80D32
MHGFIILLLVKHNYFGVMTCLIVPMISMMFMNESIKSYRVSFWVTMIITLHSLARKFRPFINIFNDGLLKAMNFFQQHNMMYSIPFVLKVLFVPSVFACFWIVQFAINFSYLNFDENAFKDRWLIMVFAMAADSCKSLWTLMGLCAFVSYAAYCIHNGCRIYLMGFNGQHIQYTEQFNGAIEGILFLFLAFQAQLLSSERIQKMFIIGIVLFIVLSSTLGTLYEMANPVLLLLSSSNNRNILDHVRVLSFILVLLVIPVTMTYYFIQVFSADIWIVIISLGCLLTSINTLGSLMVYVLFMIDNFRSEPWENLDDVVYFIHGFGHLVEFIVAIWGVCLGGFDALSELSIKNGTFILVHFYFNVWQSARSGWKSLKLRRGAMKKITTLKQATVEELNLLDDVCPICYEKMATARITPCLHYFHGACLRKWLYVKDECPMCHRSISEENLRQDTANGQSEQVRLNNSVESVLRTEENSTDVIEENSTDEVAPTVLEESTDNLKRTTFEQNTDGATSTTIDQSTDKTSE